MNLFRQVVCACVLCCSMILLFGCASTTLVDVWHDPSIQNQKLTNMLVVSIRNNARNRRMWEDAFVSALVLHGVTATPSYRLFPDALPDTDQIMIAIQSNKFDGILVDRRLPTIKNATYVPGYQTTEQEVRYSPFSKEYRTFYHEVEHPGYIDTQRIAIQEISVSTTKEGGQMIWSAESRTIDPSSQTALQKDIINNVIPDLTKLGIIDQVRK